MVTATCSSKSVERFLYGCEYLWLHFYFWGGIEKLCHTNPCTYSAVNVKPKIVKRTYSDEYE